MYFRLIIVIILTFFNTCFLFSEIKDSTKKRNYPFFMKSDTEVIDSTKGPTVYPFIIRDTPAKIFSMRQLDEDYLSTYRLLSRLMYQGMPNIYAAEIQAISLYFLIPFTHEEAHRSILNYKKIGSISQPFFNSKGAAYVNGVSDSTLKNLRDTDFPTYIRLHLGGLESDYMLTNRAEAIGSFEQDKIYHYYYEYLMRKLSLVLYYFTSVIPALEPNLSEESNELDRDIVGHDVYGAIRHLHRPTMEFRRYTKYEDLTAIEKNFVPRVAFRSLLNFINPLLIGKQNINLSENVKLNFGLGYSMAPFGDFIDNNFWLMLYNKYKFHFYFRENENRLTWFPACGIRIDDFVLYKVISSSFALHFWSQPKNLDFNTIHSQQGGAFDIMLKYNFLPKESKVKSVSIDLGLIYKSKGYLPEEVYLEEHFGVRLGTTFSY
jgi:hypothetical protein